MAILLFVDDVILALLDYNFELVGCVSLKEGCQQLCFWIFLNVIFVMFVMLCYVFFFLFV